MRISCLPLLRLGLVGSLLGLGPGLAAGARAAELDCLIQPWRALTVSAAIEGVVEDVMVDRGDVVEKGQVVARLESSVERASVALARSRAAAVGEIERSQAQLAYARRSLSRQERLEAQSIVSQSEMDEALSAMQVAEAQVLAARELREQAGQELKRAEAILERRTIRSPVDGVVVERILNEGEYADPPQIVKLAQIDPLRVEVFAPVDLFGRILVGMEAEIRPEEAVGGVYHAKVTVVDRVIDAASATFGVRLELPNPDHAVPAGLNCRVDFPVEEAPPTEGDALPTEGDPLLAPTVP